MAPGRTVRSNAARTAAALFQRAVRPAQGIRRGEGSVLPVQGTALLLFPKLGTRTKTYRQFPRTFYSSNITELRLRKRHNVPEDSFKQCHSGSHTRDPIRTTASLLYTARPATPAGSIDANRGKKYMRGVDRVIRGKMGPRDPLIAANAAMVA